MKQVAIYGISPKLKIAVGNRPSDKATTTNVKMLLKEHFRGEIIGLVELMVVRKMKRLVMMKTRGGFGFLSISGESPIKSNAQRGTRCRK